MLDHMTFRVRDIQRCKQFYVRVLKPLGYRLAYEAFHDGNVLGFAYSDVTHPSGEKIDTWFVDGPSPYGGVDATVGCHLCWKATSRSAVDALHLAALQAGATDNGGPGLRPHYHPNYYGAFVIDLEGNNIEAVCHTPE
jgi:catechol 2,3-dioxygenase-like lactoylglutathione lyase family enzyme